MSTATGKIVAHGKRARPEPELRPVAPPPARKRRQTQRLVSGPDAAGACAAYVRLAAQLHALRKHRVLTTLMVASALPNEGKSLTVANLALALSGTYGKRVLLVDADLRRPSLHEIFDVPNSAGLSEALLDPAITALRPVVLWDKLAFVPAGNADRDPLAALTSSHLDRLLADQAKRFDWVIVDAPPLVVFPDAHLLASAADGVLVVVRAGSTPLADVEATVKILGRDRVVGVVLNRASTPSSGYYSKPYYGKPSSGGGRG
jgi:capsular exopolysaccharide synthesis family protein